MAGFEEDAALEYLKCRFARILVFRRAFSGAQRNDGLTELVLMATEDSFGTSSARRVIRLSELMSGESYQ